MSEKLRWGLLSTANINKALINPLRQAKRSELVAVASRDAAKATAYANEWNIPKAHGSYEALLADPEIDVVISTGGTTIMDLGTLRLPFRGWYRKSDGADMELNGAVPDIQIWPDPSDEASGTDRQIEKAVEALRKDVAAEQAKTAPELKPASGR